MAHLELNAISKSFDGFNALSNVSFDVESGEIHALLGENGAGKSSLMNVAAGLYAADEGNIRIGGRELTLGGPAEAKRLGIGMVHQHYRLVKAFNAVENILLAMAGSARSISQGDIEAAIHDQMDTLGFSLDMRRPVGNLSIAEQQRVEILKVLVEGAKILILDEPTAVLTDQEANRLLAVMRNLAQKGAAIVFVTHKLNEVQGHADRVTVMRGGKNVLTADPNRLSRAELTSLVVGGNISDTPARAKSVGPVILSIEGVTGRRADGHVVLSEANVELRSGEIFGIAGVSGNGQTELADILLGVGDQIAGRILLQEFGDISAVKTSQRRALGMVSIPADRQSYGLASELSVLENYSVTSVLAGHFGGWLRVDNTSARVEAEKAMRNFDVQGVRRIQQKAALLSGGNAQKLVIAREFSRKPRIVVAHSPSRGLDMRATSEVHSRLREARDHGAAVLLISEDLDEILLLADRLGVMSRGRIVAEFNAPADRQAIGAAMVHHV
jgi:ABC-type uncharacterized transport system ATPase subunit